ncbi:hypothetical protein EJ06DRAFT_466749, partial [Trichodelitschia bisporula]
MAKAKAPPVTKKPPNKHVSARLAYLYRATRYLAEVQARSPNSATSSLQAKSPNTSETPPNGLIRHLASNVFAVSLKSQVRLSSEVKRTLCKRCNSVLLGDQTCHTYIENKSRGGKKPWAGVRVVECTTCDFQKRYPVNAERQPKKGTRKTVP